MPHLYGLRYPRQPSSRVTLAEVNFNLFLCKINQSFTLGLKTRPGGLDNSGERVLSPWQVTLVSGTTFPFINALAHLTGTTLGMASVTSCLYLGFKAKIRIKEVKINLAKPTVIE